MSAWIHDPRHRYSYELRPAVELDHELRALAGRLEHAGLLESGASTAPRFQPHVTLLRAASSSTAAVEAAAEVVRAHPAVVLDCAGTFGEGRIVYVQMRGRALLDAARASAIEQLDPDHLDPLVHARAWTPHLTVAYAVPEQHRAAARTMVEQALPIRGSWGVAQCWDLDVRPTRLVAEAPVRAAGDAAGMA